MTRKNLYGELTYMGNNDLSERTPLIGYNSEDYDMDADSRTTLIQPDNSTFVNGVKLRRSRKSFRKPSGRRLVEKNGKRNIRSKHIPRDRYLQDIFTTIIDAKWWWTLSMVCLFYLGSWLVFGFFWWLIMLTHGEKCFDNVRNFTEAFLLSVETSMTIGYGGRQVRSECPETTLMLIIQSLLSCIIEACMVGLIYNKIARPGKRQSTIVFSENAVVNKRDDKVCLMFKVADVRKRQLIECHVRLHLFRTYRTLEGKILRQQDQLRVGMDWYNIRDESDRVFLIEPCNVIHVVDRKSPFYNMTRDMYYSSDWELVVILEGIVEATGCSLQTRTSYLPEEVLWGYDFVEYDEWTENEGILYELKNINNVQPVTYFVPTCSAKEYYTNIGKDPDPNDVYGEQDELWDDNNFIEPGESTSPPNPVEPGELTSQPNPVTSSSTAANSARILPTHRDLYSTPNLVT